MAASSKSVLLLLALLAVAILVISTDSVMAGESAQSSKADQLEQHNADAAKEEKLFNLAPVVGSLRKRFHWPSPTPAAGSIRKRFPKIWKPNPDCPPRYQLVCCKKNQAGRCLYPCCKLGSQN